MSFERLVDEAIRTPFEGWDWSIFDGRLVSRAPSWDYREIAQRHLRSASSVLDLGTGGGELLSSLTPLPPRTVATEGYPPNVDVARRNLAPLGAEVVDTTALGEEQSPLPFPDASFELVLSKHEAYDPAEVRRVLRPDGWFVTQQVGGRDVAGLNEALGAPSHTYQAWDLETAATALTRAGFDVTDQQEEHVPAGFHDIGAVVLFLQVAPWQIPGFTVDRYREQLRRLHDQISAGTPLAVTDHRFLIVARARPSP